MVPHWARYGRFIATSLVIVAQVRLQMRKKWMPEYDRHLKWRILIFYLIFVPITPATAISYIAKAISVRDLV